MPYHAGDAWWRGDNAVVVYITHHPAKQRRDDDGHQHRRMNVARSENRNNKESENPQQHAVRGQVADADQRFRVSDDHAGIFQPHHADKQADAAGDAHAQADRNVGDHPVTHAEDSQQ